MGIGLLAFGSLRAAVATYTVIAPLYLLGQVLCCLSRAEFRGRVEDMPSIRKETRLLQEGPICFPRKANRLG